LVGPSKAPVFFVFGVCFFGVWGKGDAGVFFPHRVVSRRRRETALRTVRAPRLSFFRRSLRFPIAVGKVGGGKVPSYTRPLFSLPDSSPPVSPNFSAGVDRSPRLTGRDLLQPEPAAVFFTF